MLNDVFGIYQFNAVALSFSLGGSSQRSEKKLSTIQWNEELRLVCHMAASARDTGIAQGKDANDRPIDGCLCFRTIGNHSYSRDSTWKLLKLRNKIKVFSSCCGYGLLQEKDGIFWCKEGLRFDSSSSGLLSYLSRCSFYTRIGHNSKARVGRERKNPSVGYPPHSCHCRGKVDTHLSTMGGCCCGLRKSDVGARDTSEILYFRSEDSELLGRFSAPATDGLTRRRVNSNYQMTANDFNHDTSCKELSSFMTCEHNGQEELSTNRNILLQDVYPTTSYVKKAGGQKERPPKPPRQRRSSLEPVILNEEFGESSYLWLGVQRNEADVVYYENTLDHGRIEVLAKEAGNQTIIHDDRTPVSSETDINPLKSIELELTSSWDKCFANGAGFTTDISHSLAIDDGGKSMLEKDGITYGFDDAPCIPSPEEEITDENCLLHLSDTPLLACVTMISDPTTHKRHLVTAALKKGLLDYETAVILLEGQIQAGGIVHISRSNAWEIACLRLIAVEEAKTRDLIDGRMYGRLKEFEDTVKDVFDRAIEEQCHYDSNSDTQMRMIQLQANVGGIMDFATLDFVPMSEGVRRRMIESDIAQEIVNKQIVSGGIVQSSPFARLPLRKATESGLIPKEYANAFHQLEQLYHGIIDPNTNENTTYAMCVRRGILSRETIVQFLIKQALEHGGWIRNPFSNEWLPITRAMHEGLVDVEMWEAVERAVMENKRESTLIHPMWLRPVSYFDFLNSGNSGEESSQCKVITACNMFNGVYDSRYNENVSICEAFKRDLTDRQTAKRLLKAQMESGGLVDIVRKERIPVSKALSRKIVDFPMAVSLIQQDKVSPCSISKGRSVVMISIS